MGFFSSDSGGVQVLPQRQWQKEGIRFLQNLLRSDMTVEPQGVAPMTEVEQAGQAQLGQYVSGASFQDPQTGPYWQGLRAEMEREEAKGASELRRQAQLGGMWSSGPALRAEGEYRGQMANQRLSLLGQLLDAERARDNPLARASAAMSLGGLPRLLEQAQMQSDYAAMMENMQRPYQTQLAQALMQHQPTTYMSAPQASGFAQIAGPLSALMMGAAALGPFSGAGGGAAADMNYGGAGMAQSIASTPAAYLPGGFLWGG